MARELAAAECAAVYGRIGTTTQEFGTLACWLVDVLNVLTGNLDREGGAMFPRAAAGQRNAQRHPGARQGRDLSAAGRAACAGCREVLRRAARCPAWRRRSTRPGEGQVRALVTVAGNPARSHAEQRAGSSARWSSSSCMVSVDIYLNETTRHADVILPGAGAAREAALRHRALPARRAQRGATTRRR